MTQKPFQAKVTETQLQSYTFLYFQMPQYVWDKFWITEKVVIRVFCFFFPHVLQVRISEEHGPEFQPLEMTVKGEDEQ